MIIINKYNYTCLLYMIIDYKEKYLKYKKKYLKLKQTAGKINRPKDFLSSEKLSDETCQEYFNMNKAPAKSVFSFANTNWNTCKDWKGVNIKFDEVEKKVSDLTNNINKITINEINSLKKEFSEYKKNLENENKKDLIWYNDPNKKRMFDIEEKISELFKQFSKNQKEKEEKIKKDNYFTNFNLCQLLKESLKAITDAERHKKAYEDKLNHLKKGSQFYNKFSFLNDIKKEGDKYYLVIDEKRKDMTDQINNCKYEYVESDWLKSKRTAEEKDWDFNKWKEKIDELGQNTYEIKQFRDSNYTYIQNSNVLKTKEDKQKVFDYIITKHNINLEKQLGRNDQQQKSDDKPEEKSTLQKNLEKEGIDFTR